MKFYYIILLLLPLSCYGFPSTSDKPIAVLDDSDTATDSLAKESQITKRSGGGSSFDFIAHLKSGILGGLTKASSSSSSSSSSSTEYKSHNSYGHGNSVEFDPWSLKKSVLNTIFQAVKAITGGVTAIKGQLIKGSGYALAAGGNLVAASGDKVTDVGKAIVNSAQLVPHHSHGGVGAGGTIISKFSSLSGAASSGSSGSSSGHPNSAEIHGETVETYEIPSGPTVVHHHTNYGPPIASKPFSGGGYGTGPYHGAAAYEGHDSYYNEYQGQRNNGGGYHYKFKKEISSPSQYPLTNVETEKATIALKEIIHLLPMTKTATKTFTKTTTGFNNGHDNSNHYNNLNTKQSFGLSPIETYAITQSLTTGYGLPKEFDPEKTGLEVATSKSFDIQSAASNLDENVLQNTTSKNTPHPFNLYHEMSNKYKNQQKDFIETYHQSQNQNLNSHQSHSNNNFNKLSDSSSSGNLKQYDTQLNRATGQSGNVEFLGPVNVAKPTSRSSGPIYPPTSFGNSFSNSIAPIIVALGTTNGKKREVSESSFIPPNSQYDPNRVKNYLRELNPHIFPQNVITSGPGAQVNNGFIPIHHEYLQPESSENWQNYPPSSFGEPSKVLTAESSVATIHDAPSGPTGPSLPPQLPPPLKSQYFYSIPKPINTPIKFKHFKGNMMHKPRLPYVHHIKTRGQKNIITKKLPRLSNADATGHAFDGQHFYTY